MSFTVEEEKKKQNKSEQGNAKKCTCKNQTSPQFKKGEKTGEKKHKQSNSKNLVMNK